MNGLVRCACLALFAAACGGQSESHDGAGGKGGTAGTGGTGGSSATGGSSTTGGTGGAGGSGGTAGSSGTGNAGSGGTGAILLDCSEPIPAGKACSPPGAHCGGPCVNSWQADNVCEADVWTLSAVVPCGNDAHTAPKCKNAFSGGELTPCCPEAGFVCGDKPDGYPGYACTPGDGSFCSCTCWDGDQVCGC